MRRIAGVVALGLALAACDGKPPEPSGVGKWRFTHTTLADVKDGICQPTDLSDGRKATWCFAQTPFKIVKSTAEVDLYFAGSDKSAPLIEIQLKVRGCHEDEVEQWMRSAFGPPIESKSSRVYWKNSFLWAAALLPSEPGRCVVHFLPLGEGGEIERIKLL
ncbi:MAG TPA: hypothetical protein VFP84_33540 [Kofleriaceae bacterium]|nr:hypothetical protein [Kofleriaceae bacterium]